MKVKLFTHTDLDGVGCAILANLAFDEVDVEYCNYNEIDQKVKEFTELMKFKQYDKVFITDISVSKEVADLIEYSVTEKKEYLNRYQLIDHHATAKWLNEYKWAYVDDIELSITPGEKEMKSSGTSLFYNYLWENENINLPFALNFIEKVRRYDTWDWHTIHNDNEAKRLNDLFYLIGRDRFVQRFTQDMSIHFTEGEKMLLEIEQTKINKYLENKSKQMFKQYFGDHLVGVIFAEQYQSQMGNYLALNNKDLDYIIMIDVGNETISYRGIHDSIDLGLIAKNFGGGGHPKAAGSQTQSNVKESIWRTFVALNK
ncbi:DHH family phosphoesterase [Paenibacillus sp. USHLN196]|uniref:DHH family phosphoesterase n=1 Tax=Paenibacillus sp. USHLN196 TaxID=3081291 RepID=UPI00301937B2